MKFLRVILAEMCVFAAAGTAFAAAAVPGQYLARRAFVPDKGQANPFGRSDVLAVDFLTTGFAQPDGSDIRVFAGRTGRPAEFKVMMTGPGDRVRMAIRMVPGVQEYHVTYGGPKNPAPPRWTPEVGLILETRQFNGGTIATPTAMRKLVEASGPSFGLWFVPNVFHGFNPFGPSDNYVSIYTGWLNVPQAGKWAFSTTSDDASYVLVDGRVVAAKPRWGRGPPVAAFVGEPVELAAGPHKFEYLHVEGQDDQFTVAAWQPPGQQMQVIPPTAFPGVFIGRQTELEVVGASVPIDLQCRANGDVIYETHHLYSLKFSDATPAGMSNAYSPKWFFGDGTSSDERNPEHIYFRAGEYVVTFALIRGDTTARIRQKVVVGATWERPGQTQDDTVARYYSIVKDYNFAEMRSPDLDAALEFFVTLGKDTEVMKTAAAMLSRTDEVARKKNYRCSVLLGERLRDLKKLPEQALVVFQAALKAETDDLNRARLLRHIGDTFLYSMRKPDEALPEYRRILDQFGKLDDNIVRLAQIRIGDVFRAKGDYDRAVEAYKKAETMLSWDRSHTTSTVRRGTFAQSIEDYIRRKEFAEAQNLLDTWGWEYPRDRIDGEWSLVAAKLALAKGDRDSALREAIECADANKASRHADALLLLACRAQVDAKRGAEAVALARRIQKDYPESTLHEEAALAECEGLLIDKQPREADKRAAEAYTKYSQTESAPKFLMVGADAALASNDRDRAVSLLRKITSDHPGSALVEAAQAKLKTLEVK